MRTSTDPGGGMMSRKTDARRSSSAMAYAALVPVLLFQGLPKKRSPSSVTLLSRKMWVSGNPSPTSSMRISGSVSWSIPSS